jgi:Kelch motif protein
MRAEQATADAFYAVGGASTITETMVEVYDPASNTWTTNAPMPTARAGLAAGSINGILYAVGGSSSSAAELATNEAARAGGT